MNQGHYYIGQHRIDFDVLITPKAIADIEEVAAASNIALPDGWTWYELVRGYYASYCCCDVRRHPDGTFAIVRICQDHMKELQALADERARTLLEE